MIICKTPFRISFFGGGTDFPSWYKKKEGFVICSAINKYCYVLLRTLPPYFPFKYRLRYYKTELAKNLDQIKHSSIREVLRKYNRKKELGLEITHFADLPAQAGLGASSSFTASMINSIHYYNNIILKKDQLAKKTIYIEQDLLKESIGSQDQIIASYGGFNTIKFNKNIIVNKLLISEIKKKELEKHCVLFFSGLSRQANKIEKDKIKKINLNHEYYQEIFEIAKEAEKIFLSKSGNFIKDIAELMNASWDLMRKLSKKVTNGYLDQIYSLALANGALGGKLLGAGGGGFFLFLVENQKQKEKLISKLKKLTYVNFNFTENGSKIIYNTKDYYDL
jgi:D-glycero-alpha-D-manno-heptose-7-phosphate kinase